jgi:hypothetical protein
LPTRFDLSSNGLLLLGRLATIQSAQSIEFFLIVDCRLFVAAGEFLFRVVPFLEHLASLLATVIGLLTPLGAQLRLFLAALEGVIAAKYLLLVEAGLKSVGQTLQQPFLAMRVE